MNPETLDLTKLVLGLLTLIGVVITALFAYLGKRTGTRTEEHAEQINKAVNHSAERGRIPLYDAVLTILEEQKKDQRVMREHTQSLKGIHNRLAIGASTMEQLDKRIAKIEIACPQVEDAK